MSLPWYEYDGSSDAGSLADLCVLLQQDNTRLTLALQDLRADFEALRAAFHAQQEALVLKTVALHSLQDAQAQSESSLAAPGRPTHTMGLDAPRAAMTPPCGARADDADDADAWSDPSTTFNGQEEEPNWFEDEWAEANIEELPVETELQDKHEHEHEQKQEQEREREQEQDSDDLRMLAWLQTHFAPEEARQSDLRAKLIARTYEELERKQARKRMVDKHRAHLPCEEQAMTDESEECGECLIETLPAETLISVFVNMREPLDIMSCMLTCRRWAALFGVLPSRYASSRRAMFTDSEVLWKSLCASKSPWRARGGIALVPPPDASWRQYFRWRCSADRNWERGSAIKTVIGQSAFVNSLDSSLTTLTSLTKSGVHFWDLNNGSMQGKISIPFAPKCHQQLDPILFIGGTEGHLHLYKDSGEMLINYQNTYPGGASPRDIRHLAVNLLTDRLVAATETTASIWDINYSHPILALPSPGSEISALHVDHQKLLVAYQQEVRMYDTKSGDGVFKLPCSLQAWPDCTLACLDDFNILIHSFPTPMLWDIRMPHTYMEPKLAGYCGYGRGYVHKDSAKFVFADADNIALYRLVDLLKCASENEPVPPMWRWTTPGDIGTVVKQVKMDSDHIMVGRGTSIVLASFVHAL